MARDLELAFPTITHHGRPIINCLHLLRLPETCPILAQDCLLRGEHSFFHLPCILSSSLAYPRGMGMMWSRTRLMLSSSENLNVRTFFLPLLTRVTHLHFQGSTATFPPARTRTRAAATVSFASRTTPSSPVERTTRFWDRWSPPFIASETTPRSTLSDAVHASAIGLSSRQESETPTETDQRTSWGFSSSVPHHCHHSTGKWSLFCVPLLKTQIPRSVKLLGTTSDVRWTPFTLTSPAPTSSLPAPKVTDNHYRTGFTPGE